MAENNKEVRLHKLPGFLHRQFFALAGLCHAIDYRRQPARQTSTRCIILIALLLLLCLAAQAAQPFISPMFSDNMVLQRGKTNIIWGWAKPGEEIRVEIANQTVMTKTGIDGRWQIQLQSPATGGPYAMRISGSQTISFTNILVGDVWLCGGQSNMEIPLSRARNGEEEIKAANYPQIRFFTVKQQVAYAPASVVEGSWRICSPKTVTEDGGFSAVGYFFARKIQSETNVPIGLIKDCVGGTPAETWTSPETLRTLKDFDAALNEVERLHAKGGPEYGNYVAHWYDEFDIGQKENWFASGLDDHGWKTVTIPGGFRELGVPATPAVCYFRKTITLPDPLPAGSAKILLGVIEKMDTTYLNGHWVGASAWVENPRVYTIAEGVLKPGTNVVTVRVFKLNPDGGFQSKPETLRLVLGDKTEIPLAGEWKGKLSVDARPPHPLPFSYENWPVMPAVLYNGMIAPVAPLAITGVIWYQGEANAERAYQYRKLLPAMIGDWRELFGQGDFPFYIVSLAAFMQHKNTPGDDWWAELREAQAITARTVPNSALAVTIDVGEANDIHPKDKKEVGERLALSALAQHYGKKIPFSGPTFKSVEMLPGALKLHFDHVDGGLVVKGEKLEEFSIAGEDRKWFWAEAKIEGDTVVLSSPKVPQPKAARYAWQSNPRATLFNGAGLPAVPFRTDDWPGVTDNRK
jgi:sialate O-acetylesterase